MSSMRECVPIVALTWTLAVHQMASAQGRVPDLDLTSINFPVVEEPAEPTSQSGELIRTQTVSVIGPGSCEGCVRERPLQIRLLSVSPSTCIAGEAITFDVELQNIGRTDLRLPWSADARDEGEPEPAAGLLPVMAIALRSEAIDGFHILGNVAMSYGNTFVPFSVRVLHPRETVVVRAPAVCAVGTESTHAASGEAQRVPLRAQVGLGTAHSGYGIFAITMSGDENVLTVLPR